MLIVCTCRSCQRVVTYLAADLLTVLPKSEMRLVGELWGKCPRCGSVEFWSERERYAVGDDVGRLRIRRPAGYRQVRQWRDEWYEMQEVPPRRE